MINMDDAKTFLLLLAKGEDDKFTFQTFDDSPMRRKELAKILHGSLEAHAATLAKLNDQGAGIFVTINQTDLKGRKAENIVALRAAFVDSDCGDIDTPGASMIIQSSRGIHAYWLLENYDDLELFSRLQKTLAHHLGTDPSVSDLSRVMRLPGFYHRKDPENPFLVFLKTVDNVRYSIHDLYESYPPFEEGI